MEKDKRSKKSEERSGFAQAWLVMYNVGMVAGWSSILWTMMDEMMHRGNYKVLYHKVERQLYIFQTMDRDFEK